MMLNKKKRPIVIEEEYEEVYEEDEFRLDDYDGDNYEFPYESAMEP